MDVVLEIALALFVGKILGELSERIGLPSLIGYIVTGVSLVQFSLISPEHIHSFGTIGLILLLFLAAFKETNTEELLQNKYVSSLFGIGGVAISLLIGISVGRFFDLSWLESMFIGTAISATSISISLSIFITQRKLNTKIGRAVLGSAIVDDILALLLIAILAGVSYGDATLLDSLMDTFTGILIFITIVFVATKILRKIIDWVKVMYVEESLFSIVIAFVLIFAYLADLLGLSAVIGAFFAGIVLSRTKSSVIETKQFAEKLSAIAYGFFVPFFFIQIGAELELVFELSYMTVMIILTGFIGKLISAYLGYRTTNFSLKELTVIAFSRLPLGEVTLVIAALGKTLGILSTEVFNALLLLVLITILATPIILTPMLRKMDME